MPGRGAGGLAREQRTSVGRVGRGAHELAAAFHHRRGRQGCCVRSRLTIRCARTWSCCRPNRPLPSIWRGSADPAGDVSGLHVCRCRRWVEAAQTTTVTASPSPSPGPIGEGGRPHAHQVRSPEIMQGMAISCRMPYRSRREVRSDRTTEHRRRRGLRRRSAFRARSTSSARLIRPAVASRPHGWVFIAKTLLNVPAPASVSAIASHRRRRRRALAKPFFKAT